MLSITAGPGELLLPLPHLLDVACDNRPEILIIHKSPVRQHAIFMVPDMPSPLLPSSFIPSSTLPKYFSHLIYELTFQYIFLYISISKIQSLIYIFFGKVVPLSSDHIKDTIKEKTLSGICLVGIINADALSADIPDHATATIHSPIASIVPSAA
jgi:hypothetical protein